jgi:hypothetical protein
MILRREFNKPSTLKIMNTCKFSHSESGPCQNIADSKDDQNLCYWHSNSLKTEESLKTDLEALADTGKPMLGLQLRKANLNGINLVHLGHKDGFHFHHCDFYRADLRESHLFGCDFSHSSLMKADLRFSNLHCANLTGCNLLGTRLDGCRLDNAQWGEHIIQEQQAKDATSSASRFDYWQQAEEIYRNLRKATEQAGLFEISGHFFEREMVMRRFQMPLLSGQRFFSKIVDVFCGYGERPIRVVMFSLLAILFFGTLYFMLGINDGGQILAWDSQHSLLENVRQFLTCCYFSVVTFTTLGYGDLTPLGFSRLLAAIEAFIGSFTLALFVVVFVKKMTR